MIKKILIANRGEIACRIAASCERLGIAAATIHSSADKDARHVRVIGESIEVGGAVAHESYLNQNAVINAAKHFQCDAIHPGYGFLSENAEFCAAVEAAGLIFIGPTVESLKTFGDKASAKAHAVAAGVPVIPGSEGQSSDTDALQALVQGMTLPVMLKAAAGGGGKGMRKITRLEGLDQEIASAKGEALRSFSHDGLIVEQLITNARHIEVQVAGDGQGNVIHLFERECSLQRRHQKIVEEAPAANLSGALRTKLLEAACGLTAAISYRGLGTVEFLVTEDAFYFLEMNPRLQVEHPVTEAITGLDLVALQIRIADSGELGLEQESIHASGHAIEVRVCAENPAAGFLPATGVVHRFQVPHHRVRVESAIEDGDEITPYYDSMVAKLISHGADRSSALAQMRQTLSESFLFGLDNNLLYLRNLLSDEAVQANAITTHFVDDTFSTVPFENPKSDEVIAAIAGLLWLQGRRINIPTEPWSRLDTFTGWSLSSHSADDIYSIDTLLLTNGESSYGLAFGDMDEKGQCTIKVNDRFITLNLKAGADQHYKVTLDNERFFVHGLVHDGQISLHKTGQQWTFDCKLPIEVASQSHHVDTGLTAPMMGLVLKVNVAEGDQVKEGDVLVVLESMKMELRIEANQDGQVAKVLCVAGENVERGETVIELETTE